MTMKGLIKILVILAAAAIARPLGAQENLTELSAAEAAKRIRARTLRSEDLVKVLADQIENKKNPWRLHLL